MTKEELAKLEKYGTAAEVNKYIVILEKRIAELQSRIRDDAVVCNYKICTLCGESIKCG
jgi:hypothetical protein